MVVHEDGASSHEPVCIDGGVKQAEGGVGNVQTFLLVLKSFIGTGVLVLPNAFVNGGIMAASIFMVAMAAFNTYLMTKLSATKDAVGEGRLQDIGRLAGGWYMEVWVSVSIVFVQIACGVMYFSFMGSTLHTVVESVTGCHGYVARGWYCVVMGPFVAPLVCVRDLRKLAFPACVADALIMAGLGYILVYAGHKLHSDGQQSYDLYNGEKFLVYVGTALFSFEGVCLVLPIKSAMRDPTAYPYVLMSVMVCLAAIYTTFAVVNYLAHGRDMEVAVILELPQGSIPVVCVQVAYVIAIGFTFPLQFYPAVVILEELLWSPAPPLSVGEAPHLRQNVFRVLLTVATAAAAVAATSSLDSFTALGGAMFSVPLLFIFPSSFHCLLVPGLSTFEKSVDVAIAVAGCALTLGTTAWTAKSWAEGDDTTTNTTCVPF